MTGVAKNSRDVGTLWFWNVSNKWVTWVVCDTQRKSAKEIEKYGLLPYYQGGGGGFHFFLEPLPKLFMVSLGQYSMSSVICVKLHWWGWIPKTKLNTGQWTIAYFVMLDRICCLDFKFWIEAYFVCMVCALYEVGGVLANPYKSSPQCSPCCSKVARKRQYPSLPTVFFFDSRLWWSKKKKKLWKETAQQLWHLFRRGGEA